MSKLQENLTEKKSALNDLNKDVDRYKDRIQELGGAKSETEKLKGDLKQK